jgi:DNA-binding NarL/FixJ family response regulator
MTIPTAFQTPEHAPVEVLVVNAHEPSRLGLGLMLQREPWVSRCLLAGSEDRARLIAERRRPAVALVDVSQLGPFAGSAVQALRDVRPGLQVVLTAHCSSVQVASPQSVGASAFLPAGASSAQIVATVRAALHEEEPPVLDLPELLPPLPGQRPGPPGRAR